MGLYEYDSTQDKLKLVAGGSLFADMPIGFVVAGYTEQTPAGFLYCDNTAYSATDYPELWAVLPSVFKDTTNNTFTIDLRETTLKGVGLTSKSTYHYDSDGVALGEFVDDRLQNIGIATYEGGGSWVDGWMIRGNAGSGGAGLMYKSLSQISNATKLGNTTEVKASGVRWYIKAKQVGMPADFASAVGDVVVDKNTYSTSETIVGKWIDGKPIYRKCITISTALTLTPTASAGSWANLLNKSTYGLTDIQSVIDSKLYRIDHKGVISGLSISGGSSNYLQYILCSSTSWSISANSTLVLEYTKTTD